MAIGAWDTLGALTFGQSDESPFEFVKPRLTVCQPLSLEKVAMIGCFNEMNFRGGGIALPLIHLSSGVWHGCGMPFGRAALAYLPFAFLIARCKRDFWRPAAFL